MMTEPQLRHWLRDAGFAPAASARPIPGKLVVYAE